MTVNGASSEWDLQILRSVLIEELAVLSGDTLLARDIFRTEATDPDDARLFESLEILKTLIRQVNVYADIPDHERQVPFVGFSWRGESSESLTHLGNLVEETLIEINSKPYAQVTTGEYRQNTITGNVLAASLDETRVLYTAVWNILENVRGRLFAQGLTDYKILTSPPEAYQQEESVTRIVEGRLSIPCTWLRRVTSVHGPVKTRVLVASALSGEA